MGELESETREIHLAAGEGALTVFYEDLVAALSGDGELMCRGEEGRDAVELANAFILSSIRGEVVNLPLKRGEYAAFMDKMTSRELQTA
jgi:hypothetical protein